MATEPAVTPLTTAAVPLTAACGYNTIPTKEEAPKAQWANVQSA